VDVPRTLVVTNSYLPRVGGIQRTLASLVGELPADRVAVFAPRTEGSEAFDAAQPYRVIRGPREFLWPIPGVERALHGAIAETGAEVVLFGDAMPLALLGPRLASRALPYVVLSHGFDYWLAMLPLTNRTFKVMTSRASRVVVCSAFIARRVRTGVPRRVPVSVLYPGADIDAFRPDLDAAPVRERFGLLGRPLVVCVSRLVRRKGQDVLIRGMREVRHRVPGATLLIVGEGPDRERLGSLARAAPPGSVVFAGKAPEAELPLYYAAGDVFAMPCRTRVLGLEVEGWGNVFIEAAACGRPVVVGDSGGARESLVDGETGLLVDGADVHGVATAVADLLEDPDRASQMGKAGRARVERDHAWPAIAGTLAGWLAEAARA
jgi:phosphatidylinositol alpha-1,6-mannosyltransferase